MKKVSCIGLLLVFGVFLAAIPVFAQSDLGTISGYVKDPSGSVVPGAKVTVRNQSGIERVVNTNESGYFIITNIPASFYEIDVEAQGFQRYTSTGNKLDPSAHLTIDIPLAVEPKRSTSSTIRIGAAAAAAAALRTSASIRTISPPLAKS